MDRNGRDLEVFVPFLVSEDDLDFDFQHFMWTTDVEDAMPRIDPLELDRIRIEKRKRQIQACQESNKR